MSPEGALKKISEALDTLIDYWPEGRDDQIPAREYTKLEDALVKLAADLVGTIDVNADEIREGADAAFDQVATQEFWYRVPLGADLLTAALEAELDPGYVGELTNFLHRKPTSNEMAIWVDTHRMHLFADAPTGPRVQCVCGRIVSQWTMRICPVCNRTLCRHCAVNRFLRGTKITVCAVCLERIPSTWLGEED